MTDEEVEAVDQHISKLIIRERALAASPFASIISLYGDELGALTPSLSSEQRAYFVRRIAARLAISAFHRREPRESCEAQWQAALHAGFDDPEQRASFGCTIGALCLRNGWRELGLRAIDDADAAARGVAGPLVENIETLRTRLRVAPDSA